MHDIKHIKYTLGKIVERGLRRVKRLGGFRRFKCGEMN